MTVKPGEPIRIRAETWNAVERLVAPGEGAGLVGPRPLGPWAAGRDVIPVVNHTDTSFEVFSAVPLANPSTSALPTLASPITPDPVPVLDIRQGGWAGPADQSRWGILQDRCAPGQVSYCVISGWTWARLQRTTVHDRWFAPSPAAADPGVLRGCAYGGPAEWLVDLTGYPPPQPAVGQPFLGLVRLSNWRDTLHLWAASGGTLDSPLDWTVPAAGINPASPTGLGGAVPFGDWQVCNVGGPWSVTSTQVACTTPGLYRVTGMATVAIGTTPTSGGASIQVHNLQWGLAGGGNFWHGFWGTHGHGPTREGEPPPWQTLVTSTVLSVGNDGLSLAYWIVADTVFSCKLKSFTLAVQWVGYNRG